jgi:hypothetical protein
MGHPEVIVELNRQLMEKGQLDDIIHNLKHINESPSVDGKTFRAWLVGQADDYRKANPKAESTVLSAPDTTTHYKIVYV